VIDISEVRLKISLETAPTQRPRGVLGIWSPIFSAVGSALKIQVFLLYSYSHGYMYLFLAHQLVRILVTYGLL
jgi:hypothetical protein